MLLSPFIVVVQSQDNSLRDDFFRSRKQMVQTYKQERMESEQEYIRFRLQANKEYQEFLLSEWKKYKAEPMAEIPDEEPVPPIDYVPPVIEQEDKPIVADIIPTPAPAPVPEPVAPVIENTSPNKETTVLLHNTPIALRCPIKLFGLDGIDNGSLSKAWGVLSEGQYDNLLYDCLQAREKYGFCDWAYLQLLQVIAEQVCKDRNAAVFLQAYLYMQSGYQARLARDVRGDRLYMLVASDFAIANAVYYSIDDKMFYQLNCDEESLNICPAFMTGEKPMSLLIKSEQHFVVRNSDQQTRTSKRGVSANVSINKNLISFYNNYPTGYYNDDIMTRWAMYANTPLDKTVQSQLYPSLSRAVRGKQEREAVDVLLNWVQTAFEYGYDDEIWGGDRAFFAEETLYYPYADCEDRAILFSRIVRDVLHLDVALLFYPGHLAAAIRFSGEEKGDYVMIKGSRYVVCDPTYINAPVGHTMPGMDNQTAKVIVLNK